VTGYRAAVVIMELKLTSVFYANMGWTTAPIALGSSVNILKLTVYNIKNN